MTRFGDTAKQHARRFSYTEYDSKQMAQRRAQIAGDVVAEELEEPRLDELCLLLDLSADELENPAVKFTPFDVALAAWSNWGAGSFERAHPKSELSAEEFIVLNDWFRDIVDLAEK